MVLRGVDIFDKATLESEYDAIILCTGAQKGRYLPLEGRMGDGYISLWII